MGSDYMQGQVCAQWNPWGQVPSGYPQTQAAWPQQPNYGGQGQQPWNAQQTWYAPPQPAWDTRQQNLGRQDIWGAYGQAGAGQERLYAQTQWPDPLEDLTEAQEMAPEAAPEAVPAGKKQPSKAANLVLNILTLCFVGFLIAGSTIFAFSNKEDKSLFGFRFYNVLTPSMQPFFKPGDMIFVKLVKDPAAEVHEGDVVTFSPSAKSTAFLTHRVSELLPADETHAARMVTKGDYNNAADPPVSLNAVIGVHVFTIPFFGKIVDMMRSNLLVVCICMGAIFLLLTVLRAYFAARKEGKQKSAGIAPPPAAPATVIHAF